MLDVTSPNQLIVATGMGTRNEQLAEHYLRVAGVAAVWIDPDGHVGAEDVARLHQVPARIAYCCPRGAHFVLAYRLQLWKQDRLSTSVAEIEAKLVQLAEEGGVGLTPHVIAIGRAIEAVATVNGLLDRMKSTGKLRELNRSFKEARKAAPSLRYHDYLHGRKMQMLDEIAGK